MLFFLFLYKVCGSSLSLLLLITRPSCVRNIRNTSLSHPISFFFLSFIYSLSVSLLFSSSRYFAADHNRGRGTSYCFKHVLCTGIVFGKKSWTKRPDPLILSRHMHSGVHCSPLCPPRGRFGISSEIHNTFYTN